MIDKKIEELSNSIKNSKEYTEYLNIVGKIKDNDEINNLIEEIKILQKEAVNLEYKKDDKYKEIDTIISDKVDELNNVSEYREYKERLKALNNLLKVSSSLIEDYIDDKVSI